MKAEQSDPGNTHIFYPGQADTFDIAGMSVTVKRAAVPQAATISVIEVRLPPHFVALPAHLHRTTTEQFYVLAGTLAFTLDDQTMVARTGAFVLVPPGTAHTFWNPTAATASLLGIHGRPDYGDYLAELSELIASSAYWPPADETGLLALAARYDQHPAIQRVRDGRL